ncbi:hypothetical protein F4861DRAFT_489986 [Xylaria intraflava]|nr:hypothetical protein F4861DRAFT_489986 [Xylaria intraflava]
MVLLAMVLYLSGLGYPDAGGFFLALGFLGRIGVCGGGRVCLFASCHGLLFGLYSLVSGVFCWLVDWYILC